MLSNNGIRIFHKSENLHFKTGFTADVTPNSLLEIDDISHHVSTTLTLKYTNELQTATHFQQGQDNQTTISDRSEMAAYRKSMTEWLNVTTQYYTHGKTTTERKIIITKKTTTKDSGIIDGKNPAGIIIGGVLLVAVIIVLLMVYRCHRPE